MADEPAYLQKLRRDRAARGKAVGAKSAPDASEPKRTVAEEEAVRWAKEVTGGGVLRSVQDLHGARYAVLRKITSAAGTTYYSLEGLATRSRLLERLRPGAGMGEEILGAYEVKGGRPVTYQATPEGVTMSLGAARSGANPLSPEKMLRKAELEAEKRARTRGAQRER